MTSGLLDQVSQLVAGLSDTLENLGITVLGDAGVFIKQVVTELTDLLNCLLSGKVGGKNQCVCPVNSTTGLAGTVDGVVSAVGGIIGADEPCEDATTGTGPDSKCSACNQTQEIIDITQSAEEKLLTCYQTYRNTITQLYVDACEVS